MTSIKSAKEVLEETGVQGRFHFHDENGNEHERFDVIYAMQEYGKYLLDIAAEQVGDSDGRSRDYKESILNLKELIR